MPKHTNSLAKENSPYLLQHAHNPVNWFPWGEDALQKAKNENKPLIISIGYSACHWCHVMERESFEDEEVSVLMNSSFVCIKVDREERPDIDAIYMNAVQLMNGQGGWPLNCFALPNGKPFYGGTYFPRQAWIQVLQNVDTIYKKQPEKVLEYAERLSEGIRGSELMQKNKNLVAFELSHLDLLVENWKKHFDHMEGGPNRSPKFPLPNNYLFLLRYAHLKKDDTILQHVNLTLEKMACGGIYDQVGGGFARYSTDKLWKVPHFEKMLYDNAQLVSLYSEAYQLTKNPVYKEVVFETLEFVNRELTSSEHSFYSALDADCEGEEGKFYVWGKTDLQELLKKDFELAADFFCVNEKGFWEHGNYILMRNIAHSNDEKIKSIKATLLATRNKRTRPGLDDKQLTSWNALMLKGYTDAYRIFHEEKFLIAAIANAEFILQKQKKFDGGLWHTYKNGKSNINGFLEDYCFTIEALLALYEVTFNIHWLNEARQLADYCFAHFYSEENGMFFFTSDEDELIVARKSEVNDNVIPASNSSLAKSLFQLGKLFGEEHYLSTALQMLHNVKPLMADYGSAYSNWALLELNFVFPFYEVVICGNDAMKKVAELQEQFIPNKLLCGGIEKVSEKNLPLNKNKFVEGTTLIYVCVNKTCQLPHEEVLDAIKEMK